jgi:hypothetical protein
MEASRKNAMLDATAIQSTIQDFGSAFEALKSAYAGRGRGSGGRYDSKVDHAIKHKKNEN